MTPLFHRFRRHLPLLPLRTLQEDGEDEETGQSLGLGVAKECQTLRRLSDPGSPEVPRERHSPVAAGEGMPGLGGRKGGGTRDGDLDVLSITSAIYRGHAPRPSPSEQQRRSLIGSCWFNIPNMFVDPSSRVAYYWMGLVTMAVVYNWIVIILRVAFEDMRDGEVPQKMFRILDMMSDVIYLLDVAIQSRTAYLEGGCLIKSLPETVRHYRNQPSFPLDVLSVLPATTLFSALSMVYALPLFQSGSDSISAPAIRFLRLLKYPSMIRFFEKTDSHTNAPNLLRAFKLSLHLCLVIHWIGCFYYLLSQYEGLGTNDWVYPNTTEYSAFSRKYIVSMYWSTMTLTTIGERPWPATDVEFIFTGMTFLIGVFVFAAVVGNVGDVISNMNAARHDFQARMDQIKFYLQHRNVPQNLQGQIKRWAEYTWARTKAIDEHSMLQLLPSRLRTEVAIHVHLKTLKKVRIFEQCEEGLLRELVLKLRPSIYSPGEYICRIGEIGREMYIIDHGKVEILFPDRQKGGMKQVAVMTHGNYFGEISLLKLDEGQNKRTADVRSIGFSELLCLSRRDLLAALMEYPEAKKVLETQARQRMQQTKWSASNNGAHQPPPGPPPETGRVAPSPIRRSAKTIFAEVMRQEGFSNLLSNKANKELTEMRQILTELKEIKQHISETTVKQLVKRFQSVEAQLQEKEKKLQDTRGQLELTQKQQRHHSQRLGPIMFTNTSTQTASIYCDIRSSVASRSSSDGVHQQSEVASIVAANYCSDAKLVESGTPWPPYSPTAAGGAAAAPDFGGIFPKPADTNDYGFVTPRSSSSSFLTHNSSATTTTPGCIAAVTNANTAPHAYSASSTPNITSASIPVSKATTTTTTTTTHYSSILLRSGAPKTPVYHSSGGVTHAINPRPPSSHASSEFEHLSPPFLGAMLPSPRDPQPPKASTPPAPRARRRRCSPVPRPRHNTPVVQKNGRCFQPGSRPPQDVVVNSRGGGGGGDDLNVAEKPSGGEKGEGDVPVVGFLQGSPDCAEVLPSTPAQRGTDLSPSRGFASRRSKSRADYTMDGSRFSRSSPLLQSDQQRIRHHPQEVGCRGGGSGRGVDGGGGVFLLPSPSPSPSPPSPPSSSSPSMDERHYSDDCDIVDMEKSHDDDIDCEEEESDGFQLLVNDPPPSDGHESTFTDTDTTDTDTSHCSTSSGGRGKVPKPAKPKPRYENEYIPPHHIPGASIVCIDSVVDQQSSSKKEFERHNSLSLHRGASHSIPSGGSNLEVITNLSEQEEEGARKVSLQKLPLHPSRERASHTSSSSSLRQQQPQPPPWDDQSMLANAGISLLDFPQSEDESRELSDSSDDSCPFIPAIRVKGELNARVVQEDSSETTDDELEANENSFKSRDTLYKATDESLPKPTESPKAKIHVATCKQIDDTQLSILLAKRRLDNDVPDCTTESVQHSRRVNAEVNTKPSLYEDHGHSVQNVMFFEVDKAIETTAQESPSGPVNPASVASGNQLSSSPGTTTATGKCYADSAFTTPTPPLQTFLTQNADPTCSSSVQLSCQQLPSSSNDVANREAAIQEYPCTEQNQAKDLEKSSTSENACLAVGNRQADPNERSDVLDNQTEKEMEDAAKLCGVGGSDETFQLDGWGGENRDWSYRGAILKKRFSDGLAEDTKQSESCDKSLQAMDRIGHTPDFDWALTSVEKCLDNGEKMALSCDSRAEELSSACSIISDQCKDNAPDIPTTATKSCRNQRLAQCDHASQRDEPKLDVANETSIRNCERDAEMGSDSIASTMVADGVYYSASADSLAEPCPEIDLSPFAEYLTIEKEEDNLATFRRRISASRRRSLESDSSDSSPNAYYSGSPPKLLAYKEKSCSADTASTSLSPFLGENWSPVHDHSEKLGCLNATLDNPKQKCLLSERSDVKHGTARYATAENAVGLKANSAQEGCTLSTLVDETPETEKRRVPEESAKDSVPSNLPKSNITPAAGIRCPTPETEKKRVPEESASVLSNLSKSNMTRAAGIRCPTTKTEKKRISKENAINNVNLPELNKTPAGVKKSGARSIPRWAPSPVKRSSTAMKSPRRVKSKSPTQSKSHTRSQSPLRTRNALRHMSRIKRWGDPPEEKQKEPLSGKSKALSGDKAICDTANAEESPAERRGTVGRGVSSPGVVSSGGKDTPKRDNASSKNMIPVYSGPEGKKKTPGQVISERVITNQENVGKRNIPVRNKALGRNGKVHSKSYYTSLTEATSPGADSRSSTSGYQSLPYVTVPEWEHTQTQRGGAPEKADRPLSFQEKLRRASCRLRSPDVVDKANNSLKVSTCSPSPPDGLISTPVNTSYDPMRPMVYPWPQWDSPDPPSRRGVHGRQIEPATTGPSSAGFHHHDASGSEDSGASDLDVDPSPPGVGRFSRCDSLPLRVDQRLGEMRNGNGSKPMYLPVNIGIEDTVQVGKNARFTEGEENLFAESWCHRLQGGDDDDDEDVIAKEDRSLHFGAGGNPSQNRQRERNTLNHVPENGSRTLPVYPSEVKSTRGEMQREELNPSIATHICVSEEQHHSHKSTVPENHNHEDEEEEEKEVKEEEEEEEEDPQGSGDGDSSMLERIVGSAVAEALQLDPTLLETFVADGSCAQDADGAQQRLVEQVRSLFLLSDFGVKEEAEENDDLSGCQDHSDVDSDLDDV